MTKPNTADRGDIRDLNVLAVINLLKRGGSLTRAALARDTGLSAPTISALVATLAKAGLVDISGAGPATGGRRGELIELQPRAKVMLAIDLSPEPRRCALLDLTNQIIEGSVANIPIGALASPQSLAQWAAERLRQHSNVIGIGVAAPGVTNSVRGVIEWAPSLGWRDAPVRSELEAAVPGVAVVVENDLNLAALAEHALGQAGWADLAMLGLRGGLGAGIILGGKLHRGANFAAGELGYLPVPFGQSGTLDFGPLETALFATLPAHRERGPFDSFAADRAAQDPNAGDRVVEMLAFGCFALAVVLDIAAIIIGEELIASIPNLDRLLEGRLAHVLPHPPKIVPSSLGAFGTLQGAAAAIQQHIDRDVRRLLS
jgi:predicted NBD/HSP70 family sugar kinase